MILQGSNTEPRSHINPATSFVDSKNWQSEAIAFCIAKVRENLSHLTSFPELTQDGKWQCVDNGGWVGGHWTGLIWLAYANTNDETFKAAARTWAARLAPRQNDTTTHDLGFLFELSFVLGAKLTHDATLKAPALQAARTLVQRFNPKGNYFQAWGAPDSPVDRRGRAIIDTMMNLDLLFWASKETGDPSLASKATAHAHTVLAHQVRDDWSTSHTMDFNPDTGEFIKQDTHQGLSATSCWSRGQSWAVYGFAECYRETRDETFLNAVRNLAEYALSHLPPDHVPYWDYDSPHIPDDVRDSSAASILASGLLLLGSLEADAVQKERWSHQATTILESLWCNYSSYGTNEPSILLHATRSKPHDMADHGLIYGDYYFLEALTRLVAPQRVPNL